MRRAAIADPQTPLQGRSRSTAHLADHTHCILIQLVVRLVSTGSSVSAGFGFTILILGRFEQLFVVLGWRLLPPEVAYVYDLVFAPQRPMNAMQPRRARRQIENVSFPQQRFRAVRIENRS